MIKVAEKETASGRIILMPFVADYIGGAPADARKLMLDEMHKAKIDMSDAIIVVGTHIGESTLGEIRYAIRTGKTVLFWTDKYGAIEDDSYSHNPNNVTCPGPGIKCVCWDIERSTILEIN
jgi:hypothetical protein